MQRYPNTGFPGVAASRTERFVLRFAESHEKHRGTFWCNLICWVGIWIYLRPAPPQIVVLFTMASLVSVAWSHMSHVLLEVLRRQISDKPLKEMAEGEQAAGIGQPAPQPGSKLEDGDNLHPETGGNHR